MEISRLEDMTVVSSVCLDEMLCINENCPKEYKGLYFNCYMHTYVKCPIFNEWYYYEYKEDSTKPI